MVFISVILEVKGLSKKFPAKRGAFGVHSKSLIHAVDQVSFQIFEGENFGIVGESGCGKSTLAKLMIRLLNPTEGSVFFQGKDIYQTFSRLEYAKRVQFVFQESFASLNPYMRIYDILDEAITTHKLAVGEAKTRRIYELLDSIGLEKHHLRSYPHELSGGQKQRVVIARILAIHPELIIMDEPVSNLDVSIKAQLLNLLINVKQQFHGTYIFISHDLPMIRHICDRVGVMYLGQIVELAAVNRIFEEPQHPYTTGLIAAIPIPDPSLRTRQRELLPGEVTTPIDPPDYCRFAKRCKHTQELCFQRSPTLREVRPNHFAACFYPSQLRGTEQVPFT